MDVSKRLVRSREGRHQRRIPGNHRVAVRPYVEHAVVIGQLVARVVRDELLQRRLRLRAIELQHHARRAVEVLRRRKCLEADGHPRRLRVHEDRAWEILGEPHGHEIGIPVGARFDGDCRLGGVRATTASRKSRLVADLH